MFPTKLLNSNVIHSLIRQANHDVGQRCSVSQLLTKRRPLPLCPQQSREYTRMCKRANTISEKHICLVLFPLTIVGCATHTTTPTLGRKVVSNYACNFNCTVE